MTGSDGQDLAVRRETIKALVLQDGFARIEDLTKLLGVSLMTVHRDLDALAHQGYLTKIRGGATANPNALLEARVSERVAAMQQEKTAIAAHAAKLLAPGQTVFIDDSTTAMAMVPHLVATAPITVATNFLPVIGKLAGVAGVELIVLGGVYHAVPEACFGSRTVEQHRPAARRSGADVDDGDHRCLLLPPVRDHRHLAVGVPGECDDERAAGGPREVRPSRHLPALQAHAVSTSSSPIPGSTRRTSSCSGRRASTSSWPPRSRTIRAEPPRVRCNCVAWHAAVSGQFPAAAVRTAGLAQWSSVPDRR